MELQAIGMDLGKTLFHLVGMDVKGQRGRTQAMLAQTATRLHGELARGAGRHGGLRRAHYLGRSLREQGHDVRLMPAQYVKPYVKTNVTTPAD